VFRRPVGRAGPTTGRPEPRPRSSAVAAMALFVARECGRKPLPQLSTPCVPRRCYSGRRCEVFEADNHCQRRSWLAPPPRRPRCSAAAMCYVRAVPRSISFCYLPGLLSGRQAARRVSLQGDWQDTCIHVGCGDGVLLAPAQAAATGERLAGVAWRVIPANARTPNPSRSSTHLSRLLTSCSPCRAGRLLLGKKGKKKGKDTPLGVD
jgi:hypothetical protein